MPEKNPTQDIKGTFYSFKTSQMPLLEKLSEKVQEMRKAGKLSPKVLVKIRKYFRIKNIYHSNAIEGNVLAVGETRQVVEHGLTLTGKPLKDQAEAKNLNDALDFLEELASSSDRPIIENDVREIHSFVLKGIHEDAGKYRTVSVEISGSEYKTPSPSSIPIDMKGLGEWLGSISIVNEQYGVLEAILYAAVAHTWLVYIHPFIDGNGRTARLLMNLILMRYGYPIAIITKEDRLRYYDALEDSQIGDLSPFIALVTECINESLEEYEAAAKEELEAKEWAQALAEKFSKGEKIRAENEYEVWKSAMDLLRSSFHQAVELIDELAHGQKISFRDFGTLEYEKYLSLRNGQSAKKTWFFRIDFVVGERSARYLFFFGSPSFSLQKNTDVTLHLCREEPPNSFHYEKLVHIQQPNVPDMVEVGYQAKAERFVIKGQQGRAKREKIEAIVKKFFNEVHSRHFQNE